MLAAMISIAVGQGGSDRTRIEGGEEMQQLIGGIPQDGAFLGPADAAVTITVFTDLQAPSGADYEQEVVDPLIEEYARESEVRFEFHNYSLGQAEVTQAAYAATAAGEQDVEWQFADLFFRNQDAAPNGTVTSQFLDDIGNAIDSFSTLDVGQWHQDMDSPQVKDSVDADQKLAAQYGLRINAPSIVVDGPSGTKVLQDGPSKAEVDAAVADVSSS